MNIGCFCIHFCQAAAPPQKNTRASQAKKTNKKAPPVVPLVPKATFLGWKKAYLACLAAAGKVSAPHSQTREGLSLPSPCFPRSPVHPLINQIRTPCICPLRFVWTRCSVFWRVDGGASYQTMPTEKDDLEGSVLEWWQNRPRPGGQRSVAITTSKISSLHKTRSFETHRTHNELRTCRICCQHVNIALHLFCPLQGAHGCTRKDNSNVY